GAGLSPPPPFFWSAMKREVALAMWTVPLAPTTTALSTGDILVAGGYLSPSVLNPSVELYRP
ncbi:hypothetical protein, partial [Corallococcus exiguus]|uniref:hypothetical protein n=1 Tax=Corallococcus exiguus TaxID=83462 RepID=UPI001C12EF86